MNQDLREMFVADQVERNNHPDNDTPNTCNCASAMLNDASASGK